MIRFKQFLLEKPYTERVFKSDIYINPTTHEWLEIVRKDQNYDAGIRFYIIKGADLYMWTGHTEHYELWGHHDKKVLVRGFLYDEYLTKRVLRQVRDQPEPEQLNIRDRYKIHMHSGYEKSERNKATKFLITYAKMHFRINLK